MRHLNKIIFINSSSIKYAEVALDGNVHFIGTQGVGKSTLLRTILFFYNAKKDKLGIGREKQRFDDYYFSYQNAYIIYEVQHDNRCYCVLAFKVNGKVAFRFIDSPYQRDFFVNTKSWEDIRQRLGKSVHYSRLVTRYEEFRQIIYGDNKGLDAAFKKYAIVEGKQYQNIVRTIQNVFLNANLEAKFIKDTIIQSISDEPFCIDIDNYGKNHLKDFERQIKEIKVWFAKDKQGNVPIRKQADKVIDGYRRLNFLKREQHALAQQLSQRMRLIERDTPRLLIEHKEADDKLSQIKMSEKNQVAQYQRKAQKLFSDISLIKNQLKTAKQKQQNYTEQGIEHILQRVAEKPRLQAQADSLTQEKQLLTAQFAEVEEKFKALIEQENNQLDKFITQQQREKNQYESDFFNAKDRLNEQTRNLIKQIKSSYQSALQHLAVSLADITEKINEQKQQRAALKYQPFYQNEIDQAKQSLDQTTDKIKAASHAMSSDTQVIKNLRREGELAIEDIQRQHKTAIQETRKNSEELQQRIHQEQAKLQHGEASFYRWLNHHKSDWRDNIGKVIDENIAFNEALNPTLSQDKSSDLFGVNIALHNMENRIKTDEERQQLIAELSEKQQQLQQQLADLDKQYQVTLDSTNKGFRKKITVISDRIAESEYQLSTAKQRRKQQSVILSDWQNKADREKQRRQTAIENALDALANEKLIAEDEQTRQQNKRQREIKLLQNKADKSLQDLQQQLTTQCETIAKHITEREQHSQSRIKEIQQQKYQQLNQNGLDSKRLQSIESSLSDINSELQYIADKTTLVIEYQKDKRELFDHVSSWKKEQQTLERKQQQLETEQQSEQKKQQQRRQKQQALVEAIKRQLDSFSQDSQAFDLLQKSEIFAELVDYFTGSEGQVIDHADDGLVDDNEISPTAVSLIDELNQKWYQRHRVFDELKKNVNRFTDHFGEGNLFHFATRFVDDAAVTAFAVELKEFIDENKIVEYEKRVNERFAHIVRTIAKDTDELVAKETEIEKIIKKINQDFISKNFVEAIKEMEMRKQESSNPVFQLLKQIKQFRDENDAILGERDLFTTDNSEYKNQEAVMLLNQLIKTWENSKHSELSIADSFDLQFRIVENDNDSGWVEKLSHVGSEGTDVLVKAMVNILLLNVFKDSASKKFKDFKLHCMMDEIGRLHPNNVKGILRFANERNIMLINGSPTSQNAMDYRYTYKLSKEKSGDKHFTTVTRLVKVG